MSAIITTTGNCQILTHYFSSPRREISEMYKMYVHYDRCHRWGSTWVTIMDFEMFMNILSRDQHLQLQHIVL